ncbi:hypothetical protein BOX15_Mlig032017g1, partial [Macrostomum lignano]
KNTAPGMRFVGCYIDKKKRDLPVMAGSGSMSIPKCYRLCRAKKYAYFGVQYSKECWCGNSYGKYGKRSNKECWCGNSYGKYGKRSKSECRMKCSGKKSTFCGSRWRNSIYTTGLPARRRPSRKFLGCYLDDPEYPDFTVAMVSDRMTVWKCNKICKAKKFSYFGVKNGKICGCGNEYGNSDETAKANCNVACGGNANEKCGGNSNYSVFEVK